MSENLKALLYTLMRDDVVPGRVERLVQEQEGHPGPYAFSNAHLAAYAGELAERVLVDARPPARARSAQDGVEGLIYAQRVLEVARLSLEVARCEAVPLGEEGTPERAVWDAAIDRKFALESQLRAALRAAFPDDPLFVAPPASTRVDAGDVGAPGLPGDVGPVEPVADFRGRARTDDERTQRWLDSYVDAVRKTLMHVRDRDAATFDDEASLELTEAEVLEVSSAHGVRVYADDSVVSIARRVFDDIPF